MASATAAEISSSTPEHPLFPELIQRWHRALGGKARILCGRMKRNNHLWNSKSPRGCAPFLRGLSPGGTEEEEGGCAAHLLRAKPRAHPAPPHQTKPCNPRGRPQLRLSFPFFLWAKILKGASRSHVTKFSDFEFSY